MKFYVCEHCGNIITYAKDAGVPVMCCGQKMVELVPGTTDAAVEKHVPVIKAEGQKVVVEVGGVAHPMIAEHYIAVSYTHLDVYKRQFSSRVSSMSALKKRTASFCWIIRRTEFRREKPGTHCS